MFKWFRQIRKYPKQKQIMTQKLLSIICGGNADSKNKKSDTECHSQSVFDNENTKLSKIQ